MLRFNQRKSNEYAKNNDKPEFPKTVFKKGENLKKRGLAFKFFCS